VWYGCSDTYIEPPWITAAIGRVCALGGTVTIEFEADKGHNQVDVGQQVRWMADRFRQARDQRLLTWRVLRHNGG
jgi:hypothetical protein